MKTRASSQGFTLIEALMGAVFVALGAFAIVKALRTGFSLKRTNIQNTVYDEALSKLFFTTSSFDLCKGAFRNATGAAAAHFTTTGSTDFKRIYLGNQLIASDTQLFDDQGQDIKFLSVASMKLTYKAALPDIKETATIFNKAYYVTLDLQLKREGDAKMNLATRSIPLLLTVSPSTSTTPNAIQSCSAVGLAPFVDIGPESKNLCQVLFGTTDCPQSEVIPTLACPPGQFMYDYNPVTQQAACGDLETYDAAPPPQYTNNPACINAGATTYLDHCYTAPARDDCNNKPPGCVLASCNHDVKIDWGFYKCPNQPKP